MSLSDHGIINKPNRSKLLLCLDCLKHCQDMCFQCTYEKNCGGIIRSDCETDTKEILEDFIESETKQVEGRVTKLFLSN